MTFFHTNMALLRENNFAFRPFLDIFLLKIGTRKFVSHLEITKMSLIQILGKYYGLQHASEKYGFEVKHPVLQN